MTGQPIADEDALANDAGADRSDEFGTNTGTNTGTDAEGSQAARIAASHDLARAWARSVVDLSFESAGRPVRIDTEAEMPEAADDLVTLHGTVGSGDFAVEMRRSLLAALTSGLPEAPDLDDLAPADAALVVEHALTAGIEAAEGDLGETIRVEGVEDGPMVTELQPFPIAVWAEKRRHVARAVVGSALHMRILIEWLSDRDMGDEFDAGPVTRVEIGPIVLGAEDWAEIEPGDALSIGTEPGVNLKGRLVRPTGRTLPVEIDTSHVIAAGTLREATGEGETLVHDEVALGVAIGTVRLTPTHLSRAKAGARFIMERNQNNACALMLGNAVMARGALTLIDGQLGVEVHAMGGGDAPADPPGPMPEPRPIAGAIGEDDDVDAETDDAGEPPLARAS